MIHSILSLSQSTEYVCHVFWVSATLWYSTRWYEVVLPLPKKLLCTALALPPRNSQSISSRSSDSSTIEETIPVPGAAFMTTSARPPKKSANLSQLMLFQVNLFSRALTEVCLGCWGLS